MSKLTEKERLALIEKMEKGRDNAPVMDEESARHLHEKWREDSKSWNPSMFTSPDDK